MNIILCGPPFCGKSTLGKLAAEKLGWEFIETDLLLEHCYTQENQTLLTYREIFRQEGEKSFVNMSQKPCKL
ncbi:MAG: AAA family ATPase [Parachlamydiaceae bacterium]|nr:MAG: AAA family ATPase [Parachlamydiaceae bacterium]